MRTSERTRLWIGAFLVDASSDELFLDGTATKIERRTMQVLQHLAGRQGEVVSVEEMLTEVWADVVVTPDSVYRTISALRRALRDDPKTPQYIASIPRRGYRLEASVAPWRPAPSAIVSLFARESDYLAQPASIAVLPFVDMSEKKNHEYFSDGLSEELTHRLTQLPDLRVPARTSSFYFKGRAQDIAAIGKSLGVAHLLEGSVRTSGRRVRVTTQLIRADNGYHLWSNTYDRDLEDAFNVQDEIAAAIVQAVTLRLLPLRRAARSDRISNAAAYDQNLLGRLLFLRGHTDDFRRGIAVYRKAITLEPRYAAAYAGLAMTEAYLSDAKGDAAGRLRARTAADEAVALAPDLADGYVARGALRWVFFWDWGGAHEDISRALLIEPTDSWAQRQHGRLLRSLGHMREAIASGIKATDSDSLSNIEWEALGNTYAAAGEFPAASVAYRRALDLEPDSFFATDGLGVIDLLMGRAANARALFSMAERDHSFRLPGIAMADHTLGRATDSLRSLEAAIAKQAHSGAYDIATAFAWRGEHAQAFRWLDRAYAQRERGLSEIKVDPLLSSLRGDARYKVLLHKMNMPDSL
jgi:TolB-like protein